MNSENGIRACIHYICTYTRAISRAENVLYRVRTRGIMRIFTRNVTWTFHEI